MYLYMFIRTCFISPDRQRQHAIFPELIPQRQRAGIIPVLLYIIPVVYIFRLSGLILPSYSAGTIPATDRPQYYYFSADITAVFSADILQLYYFCFRSSDTGLYFGLLAIACLHPDIMYIPVFCI